MTRPATLGPFGWLGFGDTTDWKQFYAMPAEVYVWRALLLNADLEDPGDAQLVLRAVAKAAADLRLDVRGIVVKPGGGVDVILTADTVIPYVLPPTDAADVRVGVMADPQVRTRFPQVDVQGERFLQLTGPPASVDFWRAHTTVWDDQVGPLDAFARLEGIYRGAMADDGAALQPWTVEQPPLKKPPTTNTTTSWASTGMVIFASALLLAGGAWALSKERAR